MLSFLWALAACLWSLLPLPSPIRSSLPPSSPRWNLTDQAARFYDTSSLVQNGSGLGGPPGSVVFLKTHKTGSSTVVGILWRLLCLKERRNCFLPPYDHPGRTFDPTNDAHFAYMARASSGTAARTVADPASAAQQFDVWLSHIKFHPQLFELMVPPILPITIVRQPGARLQSAWYWYRIGDDLSAAARQRPALSAFASRNVTLLDLVREIDSLAAPRPDGGEAAAPLLGALRQVYPAQQPGRYRSGLDSMSQELTGLSTTDGAFDDEFRHLLAAVRGRRLFAMVLERLEESVLVLQRLLYPHEAADVALHVQRYVFLKQKVQDYRFSDAVALTAAQVAALAAPQRFDAALYATADAALSRWMQQLYPDRAEAERLVGALKEAFSLVERHCGGDARQPAAPLPPHLRDVDCAALRRDNREAVRAFYDAERAS